MIFYEGMTTVNLLEFWEEASSDIARTLEGSKEDLDGFLPSFEILSCGGGEDLAWSSETFVLVYFCDDVEGFSHYEVVCRDGKNGGNLLSNEFGGAGNIVILEKVNIMLDILDA